MLEELAARLGIAPAVLQVALAVAVAWVLLWLLRRAYRRRRREALERRLGPEAARRGMRFHPQGELRAAGLGAPPSARETWTFSGSARGVAWRAEVEEDPHELRNVRRVRHERTRLTYAAGALPPGRFVLVMALAAGHERWEAQAPQGSGLLAGIARRALEATVDLYAGAYFGARQRALVNVEGSATVEAPAGFWVLANDEAAARRLLAGEAPRLLSALRSGEAGPWRGRPFGDFGLLLSPEGLTVGCQAALREPAALGELAEWGAGLAEEAARPLAAG